MAVDGGDQRARPLTLKFRGMVVTRKVWASERAEWRKVRRSGRDWVVSLLSRMTVLSSPSKAGWQGSEVKGRGQRRMIDGIVFFVNYFVE